MHLTLCKRKSRNVRQREKEGRRHAECRPEESGMDADQQPPLGLSEEHCGQKEKQLFDEADVENANLLLQRKAAVGPNSPQSSEIGMG